MGFLKRLGSLFSGAAGGADGAALFVYVRIHQTGEIVLVRVHKGNDISQDDDGQRFVRKLVMGQKSFDRAEAVIYFDNHFRVMGSEITGGELASEAEYLAQEKA